jgi:hypothetical protein
MAKRRVNIYVDGETYDRVKSICGRFGNDLSVSSLLNQTLHIFDAQFSPALERALAGDKDAALELVQLSGLTGLSQVSALLGEIHTERTKLSSEARAT